MARQANISPWESGTKQSLCMTSPDNNVQVAPQETEITSYLVSAIDNTMDADDSDFGDFKL